MSKNYLIFSDSHGNYKNMQEAIDKAIPTPDAIFYLGDGNDDLQYLQTNGIPIFAVRGNNEYLSTSIPETKTVDIFEGGHKIFLTHGHKYSVKWTKDNLIETSLTLKCNIALFGHTHERYEECIPKGTLIHGQTLLKDFWLFNPGSIRYDGSFGTLTIQGDTILFGHGTV